MLLVVFLVAHGESLTTYDDCDDDDDDELIRREVYVCCSEKSLKYPNDHQEERLHLPEIREWEIRDADPMCVRLDIHAEMMLQLE